MISIGIDPGLKGAVAIIKESRVDDFGMPIGEDVIQLYKMPLIDNRIDIMSIVMFLETNISKNKNVFCVIEKAQTMPKQGITSAFNYGESYGELKAMLKFLKIPFQEIRPQVWKKEFNLNTDKKRSASTCINLFPSIKEKLYGPKGGLKDGLAEALLMAEYGIRIYDRRKLEK